MCVHGISKSGGWSLILRQRQATNHLSGLDRLIISINL